MDFIFFLGRFHVLALHLPIGLLLVAALADVLSRRPRYRHLHAALPFLWGASALSAVLTVALGYMHFAEGGFDGPSAGWHRLYGTALAVASVAIWFVSARMRVGYLKARTPLIALALALVVLTGHYGGNLTHGSTYLLEYAPAPLRSAVGLGARRPPVTDLLVADPYFDVVQPIFEARCTNCHNDDKRSGELNLASLDGLLAGGETGAVVGASGTAGSELYRRITLPEDHDEFMPAEGKTPLTENQVAILGWWIDAGLPRETTFGALGLDADLRARLNAELGLDGAALAASGGLAIAAPDAAIVQRLIEAGFGARAVSQSDPRLVVNVQTGADLSDAQLEALGALAPAVLDLNLSRSGLSDDDLARFAGRLSQAVHLRLDNNALGDAGVAGLAGLESLRTLNLYGNAAVSDASVETLAALPSLERLYVWGTGLTESGLARLRERRPELSIQAGLSE